MPVGKFPLEIFANLTRKQTNKKKTTPNQEVSLCFCLVRHLDLELDFCPAEQLACTGHLTHSLWGPWFLSFEMRVCREPAYCILSAYWILSGDRYTYSPSLLKIFLDLSVSFDAVDHSHSLKYSLVASRTHQAGEFKDAHIRNISKPVRKTWTVQSRASELPVQFSSVTQLCPTLCDPMNHSTPGLPVHHQLPEFNREASLSKWRWEIPSDTLVKQFVRTPKTLRKWYMQKCFNGFSRN